MRIPTRAASSLAIAAVAPVYFEMLTIENVPFVFQPTDPAKIEHEVAPA